MYTNDELKTIANLAYEQEALSDVIDNLKRLSTELFCLIPLENIHEMHDAINSLTRAKEAVKEAENALRGDRECM